MKTQITKIDHSEKLITYIEYSLVDENGVVIKDPAYEEFDLDLTKTEPFSPAELEMYKATQKKETKHIVVASVQVTLNFSEDKYSENYTFSVDVTNPYDSKASEKNLQERIDKRIEEEIVIFENRMKHEKKALPMLEIKVGDVI
jgi:hypothetical protein